jgi:hypothetical protein
MRNYFAALSLHGETVEAACRAYRQQRQTAAREQWVAARQRELLPTRYVHIVFTLPHRLAPLALQNKKVLYDLLFRASAETLLEVSRDPRHLGAEIGFFTVLHTGVRSSGFIPMSIASFPRLVARSHPLG